MNKEIYLILLWFIKHLECVYLKRENKRLIEKYKDFDNWFTMSKKIDEYFGNEGDNNE